MKMKRSGFSLLELLIAVIIISVMVGIAIPSYRQVVLKSRVSKARNAIAILAQAAKLYNDENGAYINATNAQLEANYGTAVTGVNLQQVQNDDEWDYQIQKGPRRIQANRTKNPCNGCWMRYNLDTGIFTQHPQLP